MYQLNPASLDSDNNKSESLYKKPNNKTYKNKKSVNFDTTSDEPIKTKINNVTNILSKLHSSNEEEEDNTNFQDNLLQQKSKNFENNMSNVNIINNEMNKMNYIDTNTINNTMYNNNKMNNLYSNLDDSYKSNFDFTNANQQNGILSNKELLGKLDYIVHLLEEQHNEKTNHITEELILYLFLGIFIIFVLDSFARSSKYTR